MTSAGCITKGLPKSFKRRFRATTGLPTDVGWAALACSSSDVDRQSAQTGSKSGLNFSKQCVQFREILIIYNSLLFNIS